MPRIVEVKNPFHGLDGVIHVVDVGTTIRGWLTLRHPGFTEFPIPTVCLLNRTPLFRRDWDAVALKENDEVHFISQPREMATWVYYVIAAAVGIGASMLLPKPKYSTMAAESVYSIKGQQNRVGLGEPIEEVFGRCRLFPKYASIPYTRYSGGDQYQYALFCLGKGAYDLANSVLQIEDTPIADFKDVEYAFFAPGEAVTGFDDNVVTSTEVNNVELLGTNETGAGYVGPFVTNSVGTEADRLEVDILLPAGLIRYTSKGSSRPQAVSFIVEYRQIDDSGAPLGAWHTLVEKTWEMETTKPQRFTFSSIGVVAGRYEMRAKRTNEKNTEGSACNILQWGGLRAVLPSVGTYNETILRVKIKATNQLNDASAYRINLWATRMLPTWLVETQEWSAPVATRSPIWAFLHVLRSPNGGQLTDANFDLDDYATLAATYETQERYFDYIFDQDSTVWEAARLIARVGRAVPLMQGAKVIWVRDLLRSLPTMLFGPHNMVSGSFKLHYSFPKLGDYDGVSIEYTDPSDFLPRTITCLIGDDGHYIAAPREGHDGDDAGQNLEEVKLLGCTSRKWAFREGCYYRAQKKLSTVGVSFATGMEGQLPLFGGLVAVGHDLPKWSQHGHVKALAVDNRTLTLSNGVTFTPAATHYIAFNLATGNASEPLVCTAGATADKVVLAADAPAGLNLDEGTALPVFLFGAGELWAKKCVISSTAPTSDGTVDIEALVYDERVFANDNLTEPSIGPTEVRTIPQPTAPVLDCSTVQYDVVTGMLTWSPVDNVIGYEIETSGDAGVTWVKEGMFSDAYARFQWSSGTRQVRIRPVSGIGFGDWCAHSYVLTTDPLPPWQPRSGPGTYIDMLVQTGVLTMPTGLLNFSTADSSYTLSGWKEFVPSVPPRAFLTATPSGDWTRFYSDGTSIHFSEYQGNMTVVAATGLTALTGASYFVKASWGGSGSRESYGTAAGLNPRVAGQLVPTYTSNHSGAYSTQRDDSWSSTDYYTGFNGVWYKYWMYQGAYGLTLKDEDSEQAAILRSSGLAWSAWSTTSPVVSSSARGANQYSGNATIGKYKGEFTGATPNWTYKLTMAVQDRVIGAPSWETVSPIELSLVADGDGGITVEETYLYPENGHEKKIVSQTWSYTP